MTKNEETKKVTEANDVETITLPDGKVLETDELDLNTSGVTAGMGEPVMVPVTYKSKTGFINGHVIEGKYTVEEIQTKFNGLFGDDEPDRVAKHLTYLKDKEGFAIETADDGKVTVNESDKDKLQLRVDRAEKKSTPGKKSSAAPKVQNSTDPDVIKFLAEQKAKMEKKNAESDFYFRTTDREMEKVELIDEHPTYRTIEFTEGNLKGFRRRIQAHGVPAGKRYPVLIPVPKGSGVPKLFVVDGKALVVKERRPETEKMIPPIDPNYEFDKKITAHVIETLALGQTIALQGEVGCGKTSLIEQICARVNWPRIRINFNGNTTPEDFIGKMTFIPDKGTVWIDGDLPRACRLGCVLILDELDFIQPEYGARLHKVLEEAEVNGGSSRYIGVPENEGEQIEVHNDTRFVATGNALFGDAKDRRGTHVGTQDIGAAFEDRFSRILDVGYMDEKKETKVIKRKISGLKRTHLKAIVNVANQARKAFENGELMEPFSTRRCLQWAKKAVFSKSLLDAAEMTFLPKLRADDKAIVKQFISLNCKEG